MPDLVDFTSRRMGIDTKTLFLKDSENKGFTNAVECAEYRWKRWFIAGELPDYVSDFITEFWNNHEERTRARETNYAQHLEPYPLSGKFHPEDVDF